jgi:hypothetical protein
MTKKKSIAAVTIVLVFSGIFAACQTESTATTSVDSELVVVSTEPPESDDATMEQYEFATSRGGFITLHGLIVVRDPTTMLPGPNDDIYLVPIDAEGAGVTGIPQFTVGEVPQADVDERTGEFVFVDIQPGKYAIVVQTKGGSQIPTRRMDDGSYSIFTFTSDQQDQIVELGSLSLP